MIDKIKAEIEKSIHNYTWYDESIRKVHLEAYQECLKWAEETEEELKDLTIKTCFEVGGEEKEMMPICNRNIYCNDCRDMMINIEKAFHRPQEHRKSDAVDSNQSTGAPADIFKGCVEELRKKGYGIADIQMFEKGWDARGKEIKEESS